MAIDINRNNFLRIGQVEAKTGYARATIYKMIKSGTFPRQVSLGARAVAWVESEIDEWIQTRINARDVEA